MNAHHKVPAAIIAATIAITPTTMHAATNVTLTNVAQTNSMANGNGYMADYEAGRLFIANGACTPHAGVANLTWDSFLFVTFSTGTITQGACTLTVTAK